MVVKFDSMDKLKLYYILSSLVLMIIIPKKANFVLLLIYIILIFSFVILLRIVILLSILLFCLGALVRSLYCFENMINRSKCSDQECAYHFHTNLHNQLLCLFHTGHSIWNVCLKEECFSKSTNLGLSRSKRGLGWVLYAGNGFMSLLLILHLMLSNKQWICHSIKCRVSTSSKFQPRVTQ